MRARAALLASLLLAMPAAAQSPPSRPRGTATVGNTATYAPPNASAITAANVAVTVFLPNTVQSGCDIINMAAGTLYVDMTTTAVAGSGTAIPITTGGNWHCPYPPQGAVSAVAAQPQSFVAVRY